ncbi:helix-turn-helix transcriptional regulator [Chloroflexi bacterium CFX6]|nr:helix-turn-helix transcriptional regulator [Chloroflexi bacterium CFX6]
MKIPNENRHREKMLMLLKDMRQKRGIRQVDLAERLGVPQSFISKYESGERQLEVLELRRICQIMGVTFEDFVRQLEAVINEAE